MNNGNNPKKIGIEMLKRIQVLYQNGAITTQDKDYMAFCVKEGMSEGTFYKLNRKLFEILETTSLPQVVEDMLSISF